MKNIKIDYQIADEFFSYAFSITIVIRICFLFNIIFILFLFGACFRLGVELADKVDQLLPVPVRLVAAFADGR